MTFLVGRDLTQCLLRGRSHNDHLSTQRVIALNATNCVKVIIQLRPIKLFDSTDDFCFPSVPVPRPCGGPFLEDDG
jgi:hypothetical protein